MIQTIDLAGFLMLGLLGGFGHCVGMCSPFVLFVSRRYAPPDAARGTNPAEARRRAFIAQLWYTAGRILTYVALGALGMRESDLDRAADLATTSPYWNPRAIDRAGIRKLLDDAFHGRRPG